MERYNMAAVQCQVSRNGFTTFTRAQALEAAPQTMFGIPAANFAKSGP